MHMYSVLSECLTTVPCIYVFYAFEAVLLPSIISFVVVL